MKSLPFILSVILLLTVTQAQHSQAAESLPKPSGKIILTVNGMISIKNLGNTAVFDRKMLEDMDSHVIRTGTPWDVGVSDFTGSRLSKLMVATGAKGAIALITGLDGYQIELPVSDIKKFDPILAWARNGKVMSIREKGPLWLIYPFDSYSVLNGIAYSARSVWQIERISFQ
jgi:hypothetical protein